MQVSETASRLLAERYLLRGEGTGDLFRRVAHAVGGEREADFLYIMKNLLFLPNSPTLMNAGTTGGQLSACFVLPIRDSLENIFTAISQMAAIHKTGGGTGFSFSHLRPRGDLVNDIAGVASGPVSFMRVFDEATEAVKQGGRRRGANMGILAGSHPDIREFITSKLDGRLRNFNISVGFNAGYFQCLEQDKPYKLVNPRNGEVWGTIDPHELWHETASAAWAGGDPGMLFLDEINLKNTVPGLGCIESTNPCGEVPLLPYESCNLGSINLARFIHRDDLDRDRLRKVIRISTEFLDRIIDVNHFPIPEIREATLKTRKIGLGVMGLAEALLRLGIPYESREALEFADQTMEFIQQEAAKKSHELGEWNGSFPAIGESIFTEEMRNATVTSIAPTGSLHIIANTSSGIEPLFSLAYIRMISGRPVRCVNEFVRNLLPQHTGGVDVMDHIKKTGSVQDLPLPEDLRDLLKTACEISPGQHVRMQAAIQRHVDNAVSKTVNMREDSTIDDVCEVFRLARALGCKGIAVYRYNSRENQVLTHGCKICRAAE